MPEYYMARIANADRWVPACQGTEKPFVSRSGTRMLYCYNFKQQRHEYLNCNTDVIMTDAEVAAALMMY